MRYLYRIAALAGISLAACGGGSVAPDLTPAANTEAMVALHSAKIAVSRAYMMNNRTFPPTANAPIPTRPAADAKYVRGISYNGASGAYASVVVTLDGTGNPYIDGHFLGIFGAAQTDGTVVWMCGTATAATATSVGGQTSLYPYLWRECQN